MINVIKYTLASAMVILLCLTLTQGAFFKREFTRWVVQKTSTLQINGSSNVNKFQCGIEGYYMNDTISFNIINNNRTAIVPLKGMLTIDVADLDCKNRMITRDLRKTLKAEDHPKLIIRFIALERMPAFKDNKDAVTGCVEVDLAGVCKKFDIPFVLTQTNNSIIDLKGEKRFSFADFKLAPPKKMAGLVRVNDQFTVIFHLQLNQIIN